jgi:hypothetical protein
MAKNEDYYWEDGTKEFLQGIDYEDLITIVEVARIALEDISFPHLRSGIGHELDLSDEELKRIYELIKIEEEA